MGSAKRDTYYAEASLNTSEILVVVMAGGEGGGGGGRRSNIALFSPSIKLESISHTWGSSKGSLTFLFAPLPTSCIARDRF